LALKYLNARFEYAPPPPPSFPSPNLLHFLRYSPHGIQIEAILSTHKHHDHTAGNLTFKKNYPHCIPSSSQLEIVGSAVEGVPGCTRAVRHGDEVAYSAGRIRLKVVAVPCHTRGSVCFVLADASASSACCVFTGDALFCGGCGAPFEAGLNKHSAMHVQVSARGGGPRRGGGGGPAAYSKRSFKYFRANPTGSASPTSMSTPVAADAVVWTMRKQ
jgi:hypothetical protein